jgi:hypothetical protein
VEAKKAEEEKKKADAEAAKKAAELKAEAEKASQFPHNYAGSATCVCS